MVSPPLHCIYQFHLQQGRAVCSTVLLSEVVVGPELGGTAEEEAAFVDSRAVLG